MKEAFPPSYTVTLKQEPSMGAPITSHEKEKQIKIFDTLPQDSLLRDLFKYTEGMESPENYRFWCSVYTIASHLGRRIWTKFENSELFPNFYIILAGSAWTRKTTCINIYESLMKKCPNPVERLIAPPKLKTLLLQNDTVNIIINSELPEITSGKDNMATMLTDLHDCQTGITQDTHSRGLEAVKNLCVNMLSETKNTKCINHVEKNLAGCFVFVAHSGETSMQAKPELSEDQRASEPKIAERLGEISKLHGEYPINEEAIEYNRRLPLNKPMPGYNCKKTQKLALVICISEGDREIKIHHMKQAHKFLDLLENRN